jgi:hypothetical protein
MTTQKVPNVTQNDLAIRNESVQRIYNFYKNGLLYVNRRYQRKLIWTYEEKQKFIDSLVNGFPVPLILLAESTVLNRNAYEIIDGMQRLNAICSFIEGEIPYNGAYFDLNTMVESKSKLDAGLVKQQSPILDRKTCEIFASYIIPLSVYTFTDPQRVDEVFIRINSYGKHLSRQELRAAGTLENFGELVRNISSEIRTDVSHGDILNLAQMKEISITNTNLTYGINVEDIFWVKNKIITKEMVRESRDEEVVADLLASMASSSIPPTSNTILDEYYGLRTSSRSEELDTALKKVGIETLRSQFISIYNEIRKVIDLSNKSFSELVFKDAAPRIPRYFQIIFLAFDKLMFKESKEIFAYPELIKKLNNISSKINITEGGNWSATNREDNINAVAGIIRESFKEKTSDPATHKWLTEFESLLMQSKTEQTSYDFKQGFTNLDGKYIFNDESFGKIIQTLTAIANNSSNTVGYVCVGVSDAKKDSDRAKEVYGVTSKKYRGFYILGVGHEATSLKKNIDEFIDF